MTKLNYFERSVLNKMLAGSHPVLVSLRHQAMEVRLAGREFSGTGFFCRFCADRLARVSVADFEIDDVEAEVDGLERGIGFVLFIREGHVRELEGFTYDEVWPNQIEGFSLRYADPKRLNLLNRLSESG
jgi:hypothetical protein